MAKTSHIQLLNHPASMNRFGILLTLLSLHLIVLSASARNKPGQGQPDSRSVKSIMACVAPAAPAANHVTVCAAGPVVMTASGGAVGEIYKWFNSPIGGDSLFDGDTYSTSISATDTFYVSLTNDTCESVRTQVIAKIASVPIPGSPNVTICSPGDVALSATGGMVGQVYKWYDADIGGSLLGTGIPFTYNVSSTTTIYVGLSEDQCNSPGRQPVTITLNSNPPGPSTVNGSRCGPGLVTLTASSSIPGATLKWYNAIVNGDSVFTGTSYTINLSVSDTFYVSASNGVCTSSRTFVVGRIRPLPAEPTLPADLNVCAGPVQLSAVPPPNSSINWYDSSSNGTLLFNGSDFNTPPLSDTITYYASSLGANGCESSRVPIVVNVKPSATPPLTSNVARCGPGSVLMSATSVPVEAIINWFDTQTGTVPVATGNEYATPSLSTNATYYVSAILGTCETIRIPVTAIINTPPEAPQATGGSRCGPGIVQLTAITNVPGATLSWYDSLTATTPLSSGPTFGTPTISATTTYFVSANIPGCESERISVVATIEPGPESPQSSDVSQCGPGTFVLNATTAVPSAVITWYDALGATSPVGTGSTYNTPSISTTTSYFVSVTLPGCESGRVEVKANVILIPPSPTVSDASACGTTATLNSNVTSGGSRWYETNTSPLVLGSDIILTTPVQPLDTFWVSATSTVGALTCESERSRIIVTAHPIPPLPSGGDVNRCGPGEIQLVVSTQGQGAQTFAWVNQGGDTVARTNVFKPNLTNSTEFFASYTDGFGCSSAPKPIKANVVTPPVAGATATPSSITKGEVAKLSATGGGTYAWSPTTGLSGFAGANVEAVPQETITYKVKVNLNGCIDSAEVTVEVLLTDEVPNLFTPNSDNEHELWEVPGILAYPQSKILVFNRWGTKVYEASPYKNDWDGGSLPDGTYYYTLEYGSGKSTRTGSVTIVRK